MRTPDLNDLRNKVAHKNLSQFENLNRSKNYNMILGVMLLTCLSIIIIYFGFLKASTNNSIFEKKDVIIKKPLVKNIKYSLQNGFTQKNQMEIYKRKKNLKTKNTAYDYNNPLTWNWNYYEYLKLKYGEKEIKKSFITPTNKCGPDWISGTPSRAYKNKKSNNFGVTKNIKALQRRLNHILITDMQLKPLIIDGKWGQETGGSLSFLKIFLTARYDIKKESNKSKVKLDNNIRNFFNYFYCKELP